MSAPRGNDEPTEAFPPLRHDDAGHAGDASGADGAGDDREARVLEAVRQYEADLQAGRRPNRRELLARHPDIADDISTCLAGLAFVRSAAAEIDAPAAMSDRAPASRSTQPPPAEPLGDFRLLREIGRGGMGIVYEAVQLSLGRRVAVKVLPLAAAMDARHLERFRNEAQAAARLHHTNIVPVHAVGCERSVNFYAMQLIDGQSLADVIRQLRELAAGPQPASPRSRGGRGSAAATAASGSESPAGLEATVVVNRTPGSQASAPPDPPAPDESRVSSIVDQSGTAPLPVPPAHPASTPPAGSATDLSALRASNRSAYARSVATLGAQVADALEHAHRAGIVHRDIKPANLLLDRNGVVWVTDFGLAQFYADTDLTRSGDMVGTLRYMSPEQAGGRAVVLDQRTDVYSLGATLYELLTLEPAVPGASHEEILRRLADQDPRPPRSIDRTIPRELELILMKAMAREAAERYASARAMAEDLGRFIADQPIVARPPTAWNKLSRWVRRHRALTASAAVILLLAAVGSSIAAALVAHEQAATKAALAAEQRKAIELDQQRAQAQRSAREARAAIDFIVDVAAGMDHPIDVPEARRVMLEEALDYYERFLEDTAGEPAAIEDLGAARAMVATLLDRTRAVDAAARAAARSRMLSERAVQEDLGLTAEEAAKLPRFSDGGGGGGPHGGGPGGDLRSTDERLRGSAQRAAEFDASIEQALGAPRAERLRQIQRQVRGAMAFGDPEVVRALGLTHDQRARLREIQSRHRGAAGGGGPRHGEGMPPTHDRTGEAAEILSILGPRQAEVWRGLIGATFAGRLSPPGAGGPWEDRHGQDE